MMPDGFLFQYEGNEGLDIRLAFRPNPRFQPSTQEAEVFHAMQGTMVVDDTKKRLKKLRGRLIRDVVFGWRILGRLHLNVSPSNPGRRGSFQLEGRFFGSPSGG
jgi:hypothetical protein